MSRGDGEDGLAARMAALRADPDRDAVARGRGERAARSQLPGWLGTAALAVAAGAAVYLLSPEDGNHPTGLDASSTAEFQDGNLLGAIALPQVREAEAAQTAIVIERPEPPEPTPAAAASDDLGDIRQAILDLQSALEERKREPDLETQSLIRQLKDQSERLARDLESARRAQDDALKMQKEILSAEFEAEMMKLRADLAKAAEPAGQIVTAGFPTSATISAVDPDLLEARAEAEAVARERREAEARRLAEIEEREKKAADLRARQIAAPAVVFDGAGLSAAGTPDGGPVPVRPANGDERFALAAGQEQSGATTAQPIPDPAHTIVEGTFIQGVLETAIDSSLPGGIRASVAEDVWSYDGSKVLLARGTRLIGTYRSDLSIAQERALVVWQRAVTPRGLSMQLASIGTDRLGRSGVTGQVDTHFFERFGSAALISIIGAIPEIAAAASGAGDVTQDTISDVGDDFRDGTASVLEEYLRIKPTIHVDQGDQIVVFVGRDLVVRDR